MRVFTVVTPRVSWGTNISEIFGPPGPDISHWDRETIVAVPVRNWRGCFQPMIDVKDALLCYLGSFDHPIQLRGNQSYFEVLLIFLDVHSLVGRYWSNNLIATPQYEDHVTGVRPSIHGGLLRVRARG